MRFLRAGCSGRVPGGRMGVSGERLLEHWSRWLVGVTVGRWLLVADMMAGVRVLPPGW